MSSTCFEAESSSSGRRFYIYSYCTVRFTCIGISSLVGRRVCLIVIVLERTVQNT